MVAHSAAPSARARLARAQAVTVLTGAGISADSGVPTFRGAGGLWRAYRAEDLATPDAFTRNPVLVWEWYAWRRERIAECRPNAAHVALAALESRMRRFCLITQNVDGLHQQAGSSALIELHGSIWRVRCTTDATVSECRDAPLPALPPRCRCGALLRPDVVWFGEPLPEHVIDQAVRAAEQCDVMLVVGTSAVVHPAAALPRVAKSYGAYVVEVNPEPTPVSPRADEVHRGTAADVLPHLLGFDPQC